MCNQVYKLKMRLNVSVAAEHKRTSVWKIKSGRVRPVNVSAKTGKQKENVLSWTKTKCGTLQSVNACAPTQQNVRPANSTATLASARKLQLAE